MNATPTATLGVVWESDLDRSILAAGLTSLGLRLDSGCGPPGCRVLDLARFAHVEAALTSLREGRLPTLVIARDTEQLAQVFPHLRPGDDVCTEVQTPMEAGYRLGRIYLAARENASATIDTQTALATRRDLYDVLRRNLEHVTAERPVSVIFVDIDRFRRLNDQYGRRRGDEIIQEVAVVLQRCAGDVELVARSGGAEFVIVVEAGATQARALAEYLREELATHGFGTGEHRLSLSASLGVATAEEPCDTDGMLRRADEALFAAKAQGRDRVATAEELATRSGADIEIRDFENRVRVVTERLTQMLTRRGRKLASHLREEADTDGLTGLFVRRYLDRRLPREMENAQRSSRPLAMIFLDIDHFGSVNKIHRFPTGDRALRHVAGILKESVRTVDWVARYGGEELCIVMPDTTVEDAAAVAERIRVAVGDRTVLTYAGTDLALTASLGVAELCPEDRTAEDFAQRAGDMTRRAKQAGRNRVCW